MRPAILLGLLGLGLGLGLGWLLGREGALFADGPTAQRVSQALEEPDSLRRLGGLAQALGRLSESDWSEVFEALEAHRVGIGEPELIIVVHALASVDPVAAFDRIDSWPDRGVREYALREALYAWARIDPGAARIAFESHQVGTVDLGTMQRRLVEGWARSGDLVGVTQYLSTLDTPVPRQEFATAVAEARLKDGGPQAVIDWAESVAEASPDGELRRDVFAKSARVLALDDPVRAAAWLDGHDLNAEYTVGAVRAVGLKWAQEDPSAALAWARELPQHRERTMVLSQALSRLLREEPEATETWLRETSLGPRDADLLSLYARWLARDRPTEAVEWAERIDDEELRLRTLTNVAKTWHSHDPEAASTWLASSSLPEEMRSAALEPPQRRRAGRRRAPASSAGAPPAPGG